MSLWTKLIDRVRPARSKDSSQLRETAQQRDWAVGLLRERVSELENWLRADDAGWSRFGATGRDEFSRDGLRLIAENSRTFYLKNPLINRAVELESLYVWSQGVSVQAKFKPLNDVLQAFLDDRRNQAELGHSALLDKNRELQTDGNLFFAFFVNHSSGRVRVRSIPFSEIADVHCNPEDRKEPWFYKREWQEERLEPSTGTVRQVSRTVYHPDWNYRPPRGERLLSIGQARVLWDVPIYHVKVGGFSDWKFGLSEVYAALDWATSYREFLEDVKNLMGLLATFGGQLKTKGGSKAVRGAKDKLASTIGAGTVPSSESNPGAARSSIFIAGDGADYTPYQLRGASISPEDGRRFLLMVCAATGWPEPFFGDVNTGNLATARSLDRPTELRVRSRQIFSADMLKAILRFVAYWAVQAANGPLREFAQVVVDEEGEEHLEWGLDSGTGEPIVADVDVAFPPIVEHDVRETVGAIVEATTLGGRPAAGTIDLRTATRMLLVALGQDNVDALIDELFPQNPDEPEREPIEPQEESELEPEMLEALKKVRESLAAFEKKYSRKPEPDAEPQDKVPA